MDGNPDISVLGETDAPQPENDTQRKNTQPAQESLLAVEFKRLWAILDGPELVQEYQFHDSRRWRLDFAHIDSKVGIEVHGGIHANGRHTRGTGFENDREKMNAAIFCGWVVFELTTKFLTEDYVGEIVDYIDDKRITYALLDIR